MGNIRYQRTAHRITSAVNCRPLKPSPQSICPAAPYPTGVHIPGIPPPDKFATEPLRGGRGAIAALIHDPELFRFPSDDSPSLLGSAGQSFSAGLGLRSKENLMIVMVARYWQPNLTARHEQSARARTTARRLVEERRTECSRSR